VIENQGVHQYHFTQVGTVTLDCFICYIVVSRVDISQVL